MKIGEQSAFPDVRGAYGMTYRQWLVGMIASGDGANRDGGGFDERAAWIVQMADALIAELEKEQNARPSD